MKYKNKVIHGDCLEILKDIPDNSVDAVVTDPPYGLSKSPDIAEVITHWLNDTEYKHPGKGFMGKAWDSFVPHPMIWKEVIRVLKPGGHVLCFAGTRTVDLMGISLRFAGFEIRDMVSWVYGSGFPKSHNISKAIDKMGGENLSWFIEYILEVAKEKGVSRQDLTMLFPSKNGKPTGWLWNKQHTQGITLEQYNKIKEFLDLPFKDIKEAKREVIGKKKAGLGSGKTYAFTDNNKTTGEVDITASATDEAQIWDGWGTALKPSNEPVIWATKPLTVVPFSDILDVEQVIGGLICLSLSNVNLVENLSKLSHLELKEELDFVPLSASLSHGVLNVDSSEKMGMFKSLEMEKTTWNTVILWNNILDVLSNHQSKFTTKMKTEVTTALKTYNYSILQSILAIITPEDWKMLGSLLTVNIVETSLNGSNLSSKKEIFVQEIATLLVGLKNVKSVENLFMLVVNTANIALLNVLQEQICENEKNELSSFASFVESQLKLYQNDQQNTVTQNVWEELSKNLKPENNPIILARKPLSEKTIANNVLKHGVGGINIDGCRVGTTEKGSRDHKGKVYEGVAEGYKRPNKSSYTHKTNWKMQPKGRFPANLILTHHPECVCLGTKKVKNPSGKASGKTFGKIGTKGIYGSAKGDDTLLPKYHADKDGMETVEHWKCHPDCPMEMFPQTKSGKVKSDKKEYSGKSNTGFIRGVSNQSNQHGDKGSAARFFYCAKTSKKERTMQGTVENGHPTIKPIALMQYLIRLITPPDGIVLDPFCGSGSTLLACMREDKAFIGIEMEEDSVRISRERIFQEVLKMDEEE